MKCTVSKLLKKKLKRNRYSLFLSSTASTFYPEDGVQRFVLITKTNEMHNFSNLFHKVLHMFRTGLLPIIRSISTLYIHNRYLSCQFCWLSVSVVSSILTALADPNRTSMTNTCCCVHSVEILLMVDSGPVRNM